MDVYICEEMAVSVLKEDMPKGREDGGEQPDEFGPLAGLAERQKHVNSVLPRIRKV